MAPCMMPLSTAASEQAAEKCDSAADGPKINDQVARARGARRPTAKQRGSVAGRAARNDAETAGGRQTRKAPVEEKLKGMPQFITEIDGLDIHFIHVRRTMKTPYDPSLARLARLDHRAAES